ncbi:MAG: hypothetical protein JSV50_12630 [Desulfobacteraceae bacterium]|nr:MAG: hypothetical protein JSV50_12630 [Desulfobacteraceae bacterium]
MTEGKNLLMVNVSGQAGLGIAYNAKKGVDRAANASLGRSRLKNILYFLGVTEEDIKEALAFKPG